ncbi:MAG: AraC family ligand binding domain-containing protein, partial [Clostridia bacterium]|nr:AraC family ligand binding domain-containing protein [Clostridia bacterium]
MENICRFIPYRKDYHSIHTINFVLETMPKTDNALLSQAVYKMHYVKSGTGVLHTTGQVTSVKEGDIFFTFPAMPFAIEGVENFSYMYISFLGARGNMIMEKFGISQKNFFFPDYPDIKDFWERGLNVKDELSDLMSE